MFLNLVLVFLGSWTYADMIADPPAAPTVHAPLPIRSEGGQVARPALIPAVATTPSTLAYWPPGGPRHPACDCGGGGCNCAEAGKCVVVDSDCEPGIRRLPTASIAPLPVPAVVVAPPPLVVTPVAPVALWQLKDCRGVLFTHKDKLFLEGWIATRNVALAPPVVTYAAPPVVHSYSLPAWTPPPVGLTGSWGFSGGCSSGRCGR